MSEIKENNKMENFIIDNDSKAEWALKKIKKEQEEYTRLKKLIDEASEELKEKEEQIKKNFENKTSYLTSKLAEYFDSIPLEAKKNTKTQQTYKLLTGTLIKKKETIKLIPDKEELIEWLESNSKNEFIKTKKEVDWENLKKCAIVKNNNIIDTETGLIIKGIKIINYPEEFKLKF